MAMCEHESIIEEQCPGYLARARSEGRAEGIAAAYKSRDLAVISEEEQDWYWEKSGAVAEFLEDVRAALAPTVEGTDEGEG